MDGLELKCSGPTGLRIDTLSRTMRGEMSAIASKPDKPVRRIKKSVSYNSLARSACLRLERQDSRRGVSLRHQHLKSSSNFLVDERGDYILKSRLPADFSLASLYLPPLPARICAARVKALFTISGTYACMGRSGRLTGTGQGSQSDLTVIIRAARLNQSPVYHDGCLRSVFS